MLLVLLSGMPTINLPLPFPQLPISLGLTSQPPTGCSNKTPGTEGLWCLVWHPALLKLGTAVCHSPTPTPSLSNTLYHRLPSTPTLYPGGDNPKPRAIKLCEKGKGQNVQQNPYHCHLQEGNHTGPFGRAGQGWAGQG